MVAPTTGYPVHYGVAAPEQFTLPQLLLRVVAFALLGALELSFGTLFLFVSWVGVFVWLWAAVSVLFNGRIGAGAFGYLVGLQRWSVRLLAYQASLVDEYPPFSFAESAERLLPASGSGSASAV